MFTANRPVRIFLDMPTDSPLAKAIKQTLPSARDESTHSYSDSRDEADLVFSIGWVERFGIEGLVDMIGGVRICARQADLGKEDLIFGQTLSTKYGKKKAKEMIRGLG